MVFCISGLYRLGEIVEIIIKKIKIVCEPCVDYDRSARALPPPLKVFARFPVARKPKLCLRYAATHNAIKYKLAVLQRNIVRRNIVRCNNHSSSVLHCNNAQ